MKEIPASIISLITGIIITLISLWVGQTQDLLPVQASEQAPLVDDFFRIMLIIGTALFLLVQGAIILFAIQFRQRPGDQGDGSPVRENLALEVLWTAIPAIIVIGLGVYSVDIYSRMGGFDPSSGGAMMAHHHAPKAQPGSAIAAPLDGTPSGEDLAHENLVATQYGIGNPAEAAENLADLTVNVLGLQYAWIFTYPDENITSGELHVPIGKSVQVNLSASDVIHSFWVPEFRLKQDAIPGQSTGLRFVATKTGTFQVVCTELCGAYHGSMRTQVIVHTPEEYEQWVNDNRIAQQGNPKEALAMADDRSDADFLAPYAEDIGVDASLLETLTQ